MLRHEVKELRRLIDLLNDRNPVASLALDQVNQACGMLGLAVEPPGRDGELSDAWTSLNPLESAREDRSRNGPHGKAAASGYGDAFSTRPLPMNRPPSKPPGRDPVGALELLRRVVVPSKLPPALDRLVEAAVNDTLSRATRPERPTDELALRPIAVIKDVSSVVSGDVTRGDPLLLSAPFGHVPEHPRQLVQRFNRTTLSAALQEAQGWALADALGPNGADLGGAVAQVLLERLHQATGRARPAQIDGLHLELIWARQLRQIAASCAERSTPTAASKEEELHQGGAPSALAAVVGAMLREVPIVDLLAARVAKTLAGIGPPPQPQLPRPQAPKAPSGAAATAPKATRPQLGRPDMYSSTRGPEPLSELQSVLWKMAGPERDSEQPNAAADPQRAAQPPSSCGRRRGEELKPRPPQPATPIRMPDGSYVSVMPLAQSSAASGASREPPMRPRSANLPGYAPYQESPTEATHDVADFSQPEATDESRLREDPRFNWAVHPPATKDSTAVPVLSDTFLTLPPTEPAPVAKLILSLRVKQLPSELDTTKLAEIFRLVLNAPMDEPPPEAADAKLNVADAIDRASDSSATPAAAIAKPSRPSSALTTALMSVAKDAAKGPAAVLGRDVGRAEVAAHVAATPLTRDPIVHGVVENGEPTGAMLTLTFIPLTPSERTARIAASAARELLVGVELEELEDTYGVHLADEMRLHVARLNAYREERHELPLKAKKVTSRDAYVAEEGITAAVAEAASRRPETAAADLEALSVAINTFAEAAMTGGEEAVELVNQARRLRDELVAGAIREAHKTRAVDLSLMIDGVLKEAGHGAEATEAASETLPMPSAEERLHMSPYATLRDMDEGLMGLLGPPSASTSPAMLEEHTGRPDARLQFTDPNYLITTTSAKEYYFVTAPTATKAIEERGGPGTEWPAEDKFHSETARARFPWRLATKEDVIAAREGVDYKLRTLGETPINDEEIFAARLFTGPMALKYNAVLRGLPRTSPRPYARFVELCMGNCYEATLHCLNNAIVKLSRLSTACKLYRALPTCRLAREQLLMDDALMRGTIDFGVQTATADEQAAFGHAKLSEPSILLEIEMGLVDRAADLSWLSMYPHEQMFAFPPLTALEPVRRPDGNPAKYLAGATVVVPMRACVPRAHVHLADTFERVPMRLAGGDETVKAESMKKLVRNVSTLAQRGLDRIEAEGYAAKLTRSIRIIDVEPPEVPQPLELGPPPAQKNEWGDKVVEQVRPPPTVRGGIDWHPKVVEDAAAVVGAAAASQGGHQPGSDVVGGGRRRQLPWTFFVPCPTYDLVLQSWIEGEAVPTVREIGQQVLSQRELARKCFDGSLAQELIITHRGKQIDVDESLVSPMHVDPIVRDRTIAEFGVVPGKPFSGLIQSEALGPLRLLRVDGPDGFGKVELACPRWDPVARRWARAMRGGGAYSVEEVVTYVHTRLHIDKMRLDRQLGGGGGGRGAKSFSLVHAPKGGDAPKALALMVDQDVGGQRPVRKKATLLDYNVVPGVSTLSFGVDPAK